ncbi:hypothetical protein [Bacillus wiedmannii]|nr:hypothetical protein [Bacillus wiedmannii]
MLYPYDSDVGRDFVEYLNTDKKIQLFVKFPSKFVSDILPVSNNYG